MGPPIQSTPGRACTILLATKPAGLEVKLHRVIDAGDVLVVVNHPPAGATPEDKALHEPHAQQRESHRREADSPVRFLPF